MVGVETRVRDWVDRSTFGYPRGQVEAIRPETADRVDG